MPIVMMWIHVIAMIAWIGGMIFQGFVFRPVVWRFGSSPQVAPIISRVESRFKTVRWASIVLLIVTGFVNLLYEGGSDRLVSSWGAVLMVKLLFVLILIGLTAVNDFILIPGGGIPASGSAERASLWLERLTLIVGVMVVLISVYLGMGVV